MRRLRLSVLSYVAFVVLALVMCGFGILYFRGTARFEAYDRISRKGGSVGVYSPIRSLCGNVLGDRITAAFDTVWRLGLAKNQWVSVEDIQAIQNVADLEEFEAPESNVSDRVALMVGEMRRMHTANFDETSISDRMMIELGRIPRLASVSVCGTAVGNVGLDALTVYGSVEMLHLDRTRVTDVGIQKALNGLPNLVELSLAKTAVTDAGFVNARVSDKLRIVDLTDCIVGDSTVARIVEAAPLEDVYLARTKVTDRGIAALTGCQSLRSLSVAGTRVTDDGFVGVARLVNLEYLDLSGTAITDATIERLRRARNLREVHLHGTNVTFEGLMWLSGLPIQILKVSDANVDDECKEQMRRTFISAKLFFE